MPEQIRGLPVALRQSYLSQMYPNLTRELLEAVVRSEQQREVFCRFYGLGCEPQSNAEIREALGISHAQQVAVQLERVEGKLGVDKTKRSQLLKTLRKEYYKKHRPACPYCKAKKSQCRDLSTSCPRWFCGKCHRLFRTDSDTGEVESEQRVSITFRLGSEGTTSHLVVKVDGVTQEASIGIKGVVGSEDWSLRLGYPSDATP